MGELFVFGDKVRGAWVRPDVDFRTVTCHLVPYVMCTADGRIISIRFPRGYRGGVSFAAKYRLVLATEIESAKCIICLEYNYAEDKKYKLAHDECGDRVVKEGRTHMERIWLAGRIEVDGDVRSVIIAAYWALL
jgi:hypothetical protein